MSALWRAFTVNVSIATGKLALGGLTGSAAMTSEGFHSLADTLSEVFLLAGDRHARRWSKAQYAWALLAAVNIFFVGGVFAIHDGITALLGGEVTDTLTGVSVAACLVCIAMEAYSLSGALSALAAKRSGMPWLRYLRETDDLALVTVVLEDSADILGLTLLLASIALRVYTGSVIWDGIASVLIGILLAAVAVELGRRNVRLLAAQPI
jgi:divalent metal cation (Fe/Co/Zn/Cd) transporter